MSEQAHRNVVVVLQKRARFKIALGCYLKSSYRSYPGVKPCDPQETADYYNRFYRLAQFSVIIYHNYDHRKVKIKW